MKLCKDCLHFKQGKMPGFGGEDVEMDIHSECNSPENTSTKLIDGAVKKRWEFCSIHRMVLNLNQAISLNLCGAEARWFQPKQGSQLQ